MQSISLKAVVLATLAMMGVDIITNLVLIALFGGPAFDSTMTDQQLRTEMSVLYQDARYVTGVLILGTASTVLGGFLAALMARAVPYFNALVFGVLGLLISVVTAGDLPLWSKVIGFGITVPAALLGGHIAKTRATT